MAVLSNQTCHICRAHPASSFCACLAPPTLLCSTCLPQHSSKFPLWPHLILPLVALEQDYKQYEKRVRELRERKEELASNVERMEQCCADISASIEATIAYLQHYRDVMVQTIRGEQAMVWQQVEAAGQEVESCLAQGTLPVTPLAQALWTSSPGQLTAFRYELRPPDMPALCQAWTSYVCDLDGLCNPAEAVQWGETVSAQQLAYVQATQIQLFSISNRVWTSVPLQFPIVANDGSRYIWTEAALFCSGGNSYLGEGKNGSSRRESYLLSPGKNWAVTRIADMTKPRAYHGLWYQKGVLVVFGGLRKNYR